MTHGKQNITSDDIKAERKVIDEKKRKKLEDYGSIPLNFGKYKGVALNAIN